MCAGELVTDFESSTGGNESRAALLPGKVSGRRGAAVLCPLVTGSMRQENFCSAGKNFPKESVFGKTGSRPGVSKAFQRQRHWLDEIEIGNFLRAVCATCRLAAR